MNRREFLLMTAAAAAGGCASTNEGSSRQVNAGPVARYAAEGVYDGFADEGFFVIAKQGQISVLSAVCTHRTCKLRAEPDHSFYCKCHGSTFDPVGHVTHGPATRALPELPFTVNEHQELIVTVPAA
jgi:Rieske Fe-S protein